MTAIDVMEDDFHEISITLRGSNEDVGDFVNALKEFSQGYTWTLSDNGILLEIIGIYNLTELRGV